MDKENYNNKDLVKKILDAANIIHQQSRRGVADWMIVPTGSIYIATIRKQKIEKILNLNGQGNERHIG